jgi:hypothetical protein
MKFLLQIFKLLLVACWLLTPLAGHAQYKLDWSTVDAGAGARVSGPYRMKGSVGQPVTGDADSSLYHAQLGFWSGITEEDTGFENLSDLSCVMTVSSDVVVDGNALAISLVVSNKGPGTDTESSVTFVSGTGVMIASATPSQGGCTVTASGVQCDVGIVAPSGRVTVVLNGSFNYGALGLPNLQESGTITLLASVGSAEPDAEPTDNSTSLALAALPLEDFGDSTLGLTCLPGGARHKVVSGYSLGGFIDAESDCQINDNERGSADEDGVVFGPLPPWAPGTVVSTKVHVTRPAGTAAILDAWLDADGAAGFDVADRIYSGITLTDSDTILPSFTVPLTAPLGTTWARFRLSTTGLSTPGGYGGAGEVEDYPVQIVNDPPTVAITSPTNGSSFNVGAPITISATATAFNGKSIANVTFIDNGTDLVPFDTSSPYEMTSTTFGAGPHNLRARVVDSLGLTIVSEAVFIAVVVPCSGGAFTWKGGSGNWSDPTQWTPPLGAPPDSIPEGDDIANVGGGTVTVDVPVTVCILNLSGGAINGLATLTVTKRMNWTGGRMDQAGRTVIETDGVLNIANAGAVALSARTLENGGLAVWTGTADLNCDSGAVLTNRAGAIWIVHNDQVFGFGGGNACHFDNAGNFRKATGTLTTFGGGVVFHNYNLLELQSGTLQCNDGFTNSGTVVVPGGKVLRMAGGGSASGNFANQSGGRVEWSGGIYQLNSGVLLNGPGVYTNSATLTVNTDVGLGYFDLTGTLNGTGTLRINNIMNWTAGRMDDAGETIIETSGQLNMANTSAIALSQRTLENGGVVLWTGTANLNCDSAALLTNRADARWEVHNHQMFDYAGGGACSFDNAGTFRKVAASAGTTAFSSSVAFNNYNSVHVQTGTLQIRNGVTSGVFSNHFQGRLEWSGGIYQLNSGVHLNGPGVYTNNGTLTVNTAVAVRNFDLTGILNGTGTLTVSNLLNWTAGRMDQAGRTVIDADGVLNLANISDVAISERTLENAGRVLWTATANLKCDSGAVLTNLMGGRWEVSNNQGLYYDGAAACRFDNAGLFLKKSTGTTTFGNNVGFNNYGNNHLESGILQLDSIYTQYDGLTSLCLGNVVNASQLQLLGGTLIGTGHFDPAVSGGVVEAGGTVSPGCSPGRLTIGGDYSQSASSKLDIEIGGAVPGASHDQLAIGGTATLAGTMRVSLVNGFNPISNATFTVLTAGTRNGAFANLIYPSNQMVMTLSNTPNAVVLRVVSVTSDITAPVLTCPGEIRRLTPDRQGTVVTYSVTATDDRDPAPVVNCNPPSGSIFTVGTAAVICTARDSSSNTATCAFHVVVKELEASTTGGSLVLVWDVSNAILEAANTPGGPWSMVTEARSPLTVSPHEPLKFYRLRYPSGPGILNP